MIRLEVDGPEQFQQLSLFSDTEREQYTRDIDGLRHRLLQIPDEIIRETAAIRGRFANPQARLFPMALLFCIPERLARS